MLNENTFLLMRLSDSSSVVILANHLVPHIQAFRSHVQRVHGIALRRNGYF